MAGERNRILVLKEYIESKGITVNLCKNKARGNKGYFKYTSGGRFRIDVSCNLENDGIFGVLLHEFAHYIHYNYDKTLSSLDFVFQNVSDEILEELTGVTVNEIPKDFALSLVQKQEQLKREVNSLADTVRSFYPEMNLRDISKKLEKTLYNPVSYLLSYDKVRLFNRILSIENLEKDFNDLTPVQVAYIKLKSKQRALRRYSSKISRMNKYYNNPTELFARFTELFFSDYSKAKKIAPNAVNTMENVIEKGQISELKELSMLLK